MSNADLIKQLRALARAEHDDLSIAKDAADALAAQEWRPIIDAPHLTGVEIIGSRWADNGERFVCIREPFVSFWSPTLGKFYCNPTHFWPMPLPPETKS